MVVEVFPLGEKFWKCLTPSSYTIFARLLIIGTTEQSFISTNLVVIVESRV
jgi:hypothetical protein